MGFEKKLLGIWRIGWLWVKRRGWVWVWSMKVRGLLMGMGMKWV